MANCAECKKEETKFKPCTKHYAISALKETFGQNWVYCGAVLFGVIMFSMMALSLLYQSLSPSQVQTVPLPAMNVFGFFDFLLKMELPPLTWVIIFLFLWLTKW